MKKTTICAMLAALLLCAAASAQTVASAPVWFGAHVMAAGETAIASIADPAAELPAEEPAAGAGTPEALTLVDAPVRAEPDGMSAILFTLEGANTVEALETQGDWRRIEHEGVSGWVYVKAEAAQDGETEKKVTIFTSRRMQMTPGEAIYLTSELVGFENCNELKYIWECDKGAGFEPVPDSNSGSYSYPASVESLHWSWRLKVLYR